MNQTNTAVEFLRQNKGKEKNSETTAKRIAEIESMPMGSKREIILESEESFPQLIVELARPQRSNEFGGLYDPDTKSLIVTRGGDAGFDGYAVEFTAPRRDEKRNSRDIFWHTHPWRENDPISYFNIPENSCKPSSQDRNALINVAELEYECGNTRVITSCISSRGFIHLSQVNMEHYDEQLLRRADIHEEAIKQINLVLSMEPDPTLFLLAPPENRDIFVQKLRQFYARKKNMDVSFFNGIKEFVQEVRSLLDKSPHNRRYRSIEEELKTKILNNIAQFPEPGMLKRLNLTFEQMKVVYEVLGWNEHIFQISETGELTAVPYDFAKDR